MAIHGWAHTLASGLLRFARNDGASVVVKNALVKAIFRLMRLRISQLRRGVTANPARQALCENPLCAGHLRLAFPQNRRGRTLSRPGVAEKSLRELFCEVHQTELRPIVEIVKTA